MHLSYTVNGTWLVHKFTRCIGELMEARFRVRGIATDNHDTNVTAFYILLRENKR